VCVSIFCVCICMCVCACVRVFACVRVCVCICFCVLMCVCASVTVCVVFCVQYIAQRVCVLLICLSHQTVSIELKVFQHKINQYT